LVRPETDGADRHGFQGVNLFTHLHGSKFGSECRTGTPDDNDRGDQGTEFRDMVTATAVATALIAPNLRKLVRRLHARIKPMKT